MLAVSSIWPTFLIFGSLVWFAHFLSKVETFGFGAIVKPGDKNLNVPLESLRGILALSVIFHHAELTFLYFTTGGAWGLFSSRFYELMGVVPVTLFFFLSGYLFWNKLINDDGLKSVGAFLVKRMKRLLPAYWVSVAAVFLVVGAGTRFQMLVEPQALLTSAWHWISVGIPFAPPKINNFSETGVINAAVVWTLRIEILFYLSLPLLAPLAKGHRVWILLAATVFVNSWLMRHSGLKHIHSQVVQEIYGSVLEFLFYFGRGFIFGITAAHLRRMIPESILPVVRGPWFAVLALFIMVCVFWGVEPISPDKRYMVWRSALLFIPFLIIALENDLFGILSTKPLIYLGKISYSVYLIHGIVLYLISRWINIHIPFESISPIQFWIFVVISGFSTVWLSSLLFSRVEYPMMNGRRPISESSSGESLPLPLR